MMRLPYGVRVAARCQAGSGPPVVLLHGLASTSRWWDLVVAELPGRRLLRWDHRGHGLSSSPSAGYRVDVLAADAAAVLDTLRLAGCVVVGHSMGASVALMLAASRPDLVSAVCCVDGGLYDPRTMFGSSWPVAQPVMSIDRRINPTRAMLDAWAAGVGLPPTAAPSIAANYQHAAPDQSAIRSGSARLRLRLTPEREQALARSVWQQRPDWVLAKVTAPVTAIMARPSDPAEVGLRHDALHSTLTRAGRSIRQIWVDGGHDLPLQQPQRIAEEITTICTGVRT
ncbi:alpha/beta fold hydrolase [Dactylosporangium sucinum]|uniref:Hydrolase n=1 Tax=Dactylosporangium sucinum TaxID=1424081 RepID=A0A917TIE7_9ACTN|nr:alpha/beta hydrolase [Dactylosporangium sucinum]GGM23868.1 hydrolase [Dactylosporangium sucinum]